MHLPSLILVERSLLLERAASAGEDARHALLADVTFKFGAPLFGFGGKSRQIVDKAVPQAGLNRFAS
jgi:hypothetical protein